MKRVLGAAIVLAVALVMFAPTADAGFYVGGSITETKVAFDDNGLNYDENDTGWKVFGGWNIIRFFGLEAGYYDMGKTSDQMISVDLSALALSARGILPLGKHVELFGKVGYMAWDAKVTGGDNDDSADITYGAGVAVIIGSHVEIRAEYEILPADASGTDVDVDLISVGAAFRF